jgi:hypothetical protein
MSTHRPFRVASRQDVEDAIIALTVLASAFRNLEIEDDSRRIGLACLREEEACTWHGCWGDERYGRGWA